jgi:MFS family permease
MATAILPAFLRSLGAPAVALGAIEATADAAQSFAKLGGGVVADRTDKRKRVASAGYTTTALSTGAFALAGPWGVIALFRALAWGARGMRSPSRDTLLAAGVAPELRGRAFGLERAMDAAGAVAGPLIAAGLVAVLSFRQIFLVSILPGLLAATAIWRLVQERPHGAGHGARREVDSLPPGPFRSLAVSSAVYGIGNFAPTLLVLRATDLLHRGRGLKEAAALAVLLYTIHNLANALAAYPAGALSDRLSARGVLATGFVLFGLACALFGWLEPRSFAGLAVLFLLVGASNGMVETSRNAYAVQLVPDHRRGRGFGVLGLIDGLGDLVSSLVVGVLFTVASAGWGFAWGAGFSLLGAAILVAAPAASRRGRRYSSSRPPIR